MIGRPEAHPPMQVDACPSIPRRRLAARASLSIAFMLGLMLQGCREAENVDCQSSGQILTDTCAAYICPTWYRHRYNVDATTYKADCAQETCCTLHWYARWWVLAILALGCCCCTSCWCCAAVAVYQRNKKAPGEEAQATRVAGAATSPLYAEAPFLEMGQQRAFVTGPYG
mmetsp:Transcript_106353/g.174590  ORF Transcript_106353/g.174590 Transcript_106353/m.174590 type:complete len:171 (+) Transcript_106353:52-564(+)